MYLPLYIYYVTALYLEMTETERNKSLLFISKYQPFTSSVLEWQHHHYGTCPAVSDCTTM